MPDRDPVPHHAPPTEGALSVRADASALRALADVIKALTGGALAVATVDVVYRVLLLFLS